MTTDTLTALAPSGRAFANWLVSSVLRDVSLQGGRFEPYERATMDEVARRAAMVAKGLAPSGA
jgi:hypothetical protein